MRRTRAHDTKNDDVVGCGDPLGKRRDETKRPLVTHKSTPAGGIARMWDCGGRPEAQLLLCHIENARQPDFTYIAKTSHDIHIHIHTLYEDDVEVMNR